MHNNQSPFQSNQSNDTLKIIGNIIWFIFIGLPLGCAWWIAALFMCVFIVTIPWAKAAFIIGKLAFLPFGQTSISRYRITGKQVVGSGNLGFIGNIIWLIFAGIWLAIHNFLLGVLFCLTIFGIPFGIQFFKLAKLSLWPIGTCITSNNVKLDSMFA